MNVCNSTDLPEVEIISLLEEQLPHYKLRADTIYGYDHDDWLHTPLIAPDASLDLTTEQIEETLKYFLLCAERVGQMTKTYNDIDAVTRLLEEKERDLELAARIGQSLLKKNKTLSERNEYLEEQVEHIREEVSQLRHDLSMKDELLQFYTHAAEESEGESATSTPVRRNESTASLPSSFPLDSLQKKLKDLEEENIVLRSEANHLETETMCYEEKEQQLVNDCVKELRNANFQMSTLAEELARKTDDASRQQEEITHLLSQIVDLQKKSKAYAVENEELTQHLGAAKDAQRQLTAELRELEDKYAECMEMLHEAQEELKNLRNKTLPLSTPRRFHSLGLFPMDSLAAEIEGTMRKELQMDDPDVEEHMLQPKRVFQTVRNVNQTVRQRSMGPSPMNIPGSNQTSSMNSRRSSCVSTPRSSMYGGLMDNRTSSVILEAHTPEDRSDDSNRKQAGTPGTPGSRDLEAALRRLTLRRDNYLSERRFFEDERERKLQELSEKESLSEGRGEGEDGSLTPADSIMSLGLSSLHSGFSGFSLYAPRSYLPEKLQIVKPLEGSATLHQWQQLAQPNLGGILDARPGVVTKGFRPLELDLEEVYQFTDLEEDEAGERSSLLGLSVAGHLSRLCRSRCSSTSSLASENNNTPLNNNNNSTFSGADDGGGLGQEPSAAAAMASAAGTGNGQVATGSLENAEAAGLSSVHFPGKCQSHTSSTYTITTCRIMHPSDELTRVTPSLMSGPTASCVLTSSVLRCSSTPCTPRRLSVAESFTNLRDSTKTTSTSLGLVRTLQDRGISAAVYDPCSWDRGASTPTDYANASPNPAECAIGQNSRRGVDTLPSTPPNSPTRAKRSSPVAAPPFDYSPSAPPYDNFLASKPASSILKEVRQAEAHQHADTECQTDVSVHNLRLLDKVKRLGVTPRPLTLGPFCGGLRRPGAAHPMVTSPIGGLPTLNAGMRRNRSYPAMVGASMAMKGLGPESGTELLLTTPLPKQTSLNQE
ncbi:trafficking kinesin-binding protein 1 isoform X2 [Alosa sapidissima]|uniref:trafficking kinesin-binding protein 1 isoform X2 n=1 Tax=Alosa sapidissima TaxID=34773 RepID=UPI001C081BD1|nr:trafficking kinesin-binding protein 1 isoform X2 [Alosa sapidissima]